MARSKATESERKLIIQLYLRGWTYKSIVKYLEAINHSAVTFDIVVGTVKRAGLQGYRRKKSYSKKLPATPLPEK